MLTEIVGFIFFINFIGACALKFILTQSIVNIFDFKLYPSILVFQMLFTTFVLECLRLCRLITFPCTTLHRVLVFLPVSIFYTINWGCSIRPESMSPTFRYVTCFTPLSTLFFSRITQPFPSRYVCFSLFLVTIGNVILVGIVNVLEDLKAFGCGLSSMVSLVAFLLLVQRYETVESLQLNSIILLSSFALFAFYQLPKAYEIAFSSDALPNAIFTANLALLVTVGSSLDYLMLYCTCRHTPLTTGLAVSYKETVLMSISAFAHNSYSAPMFTGILLQLMGGAMYLYSRRRLPSKLQDQKAPPEPTKETA